MSAEDLRKNMPGDGTETGSESFLGRWSRVKREERGREVTNDVAVASPARDDRAETARVLSDADLPPPESLDDDADFSGYLSPGICAALRRAALQRLFAAARFNVGDGLDDYAEDLTRFERLGDLVTREMRRMMALECQDRGQEATGVLPHEAGEAVVSAPHAGVAEEEKGQDDAGSA